METIEERARKDAPRLSISTGLRQDCIEALYIAVAKEQKAIDDKERAVAMLNQADKHRREMDELIDRAWHYIISHPIEDLFYIKKEDFYKSVRGEE